MCSWTRVAIINNMTGRTTIHVAPINDLYPHDSTEFCKCDPFMDEDDDETTIVVHNSFDGREAYETGQRKMH